MDHDRKLQQLQVSTFTRELLLTFPASRSGKGDQHNREEP